LETYTRASAEGSTSDGFGLERYPDRFDGGRRRVAQENTYEVFPAQAHELDYPGYRKRHIVVDTGGLVLAAEVHGAGLPDRDGGRRLLGKGRVLPRMELLWADGAYTVGFREWLLRQLGWRLEVPYYRDRQLWRYGLEEKPSGFQVLSRHWVVERTFAWVSL
jgi:transposase